MNITNLLLCLRCEIVQTVKSLEICKLTFALARDMITALFITWNTAKKNMNMCRWCIPFAEINGIFPCKNIFLKCKLN